MGFGHNRLPIGHREQNIIKEWDKRVSLWTAREREIGITFRPTLEQNRENSLIGREKDCNKGNMNINSFYSQ